MEEIRGIKNLRIELLFKKRESISYSMPLSLSVPHTLHESKSLIQNLM